MVESVLPLGGHACMLYRPRTTLGEVYKSRLLRFRVAIYLQIYLQFLSIVISRSITNNRQIQSCLLHIYISNTPPQSQLPKSRLFLNSSSFPTVTTPARTVRRCSASACSARIATCHVSDISAGHPRSAHRARPYPRPSPRPYPLCAALFPAAFPFSSSSSSRTSRAELPPPVPRPSPPHPTPIPCTRACPAMPSVSSAPHRTRLSPTPAGIDPVPAGRHCRRRLELCCRP